jgi:hypothetical protein
VGGADGYAQKLPLFTQDVWAVLARQEICLLGDEGEVRGLGCRPLEQVLREGTYLASIPTPSRPIDANRNIVGIAPDGIRKVRIQFDQTRPRTVPVIENTFSLRDKGSDFPTRIDLLH